MSKILKIFLVALGLILLGGVYYFYSSHESGRHNSDSATTKEECMWGDEKIYILSIDQPNTNDGGEGKIYNSKGKVVATYFGFIGNWVPVNDSGKKDKYDYRNMSNCKEIDKFFWE